MLALRRLVLAHRPLAALICVAALALKLLVPPGYMISSEHDRIAITICSGMAPHAMDMGMASEMPEQGPSKEHGKTETPCAFTSLSAQAVGSLDPLLLIIAIAFVMAVGRRFVAPHALLAQPYLRPPLRGPPVTA